MVFNTLPADYILKKHNLEIYLTKNLEPLVPFLSLLPVADNDTGEFATVLKADTAKQDIDNEIMSEPLEVAEGSELTGITLSPINAVLGKTSVVGYEFEYTDQFLNRQDSDARIALALSKVIAGMAHKLNFIFAKGMAGSAAAAFPTTISDWADSIDPRADFIKLRSAFNSGSAGNQDLAYKLDQAFVANDKHVLLQDYYMSMDKPFDNESIDVDGTKVDNMMNALNGIKDKNGNAIDYLGMDSSTPAGIINKYVDPKYSTIKTAELANPQSRLNIPNSLINVNQVVPREYNEPYKYQIVAEVGYSSQEPLAVQVGKLTA